jgi:hypothetical protein
MNMNINMILPTEIMLEIYDYSNVETKIKLNSILGLSYYVKNPFQNINTRPTNINFRTLVMGTTFHRYASYKGSTIILPM